MHTHPFADRAIVIHDGYGANSEAPPFAIVTANAVLEHEWLPFLDGLLPGTERRLNVVGVNRS